MSVKTAVNDSSDHKIAAMFMDLGYQVRALDQDVYPVMIFRPSDGGRFWSFVQALRVYRLHGKLL